MGWATGVEGQERRWVKASVVRTWASGGRSDDHVALKALSSDENYARGDRLAICNA